MKKFNADVLDILLDPKDPTFLSDQAKQFLNHLHINQDERFPLITEIADAWYERVRHYYFSCTYTLVGTDNYHDCREFIIFDNYKISNPNFEITPTLSVKLSNGTWEQVSVNDPRWHLNWNFQSSTFTKKYASISIFNLVNRLVYFDLFGVDTFTTQLYRGVYPNRNIITVPQEDTVMEIQSAILNTQLNFFNSLVYSYYGEMKLNADAFESLKEFRAYKKRHTNLRLIKCWHSLNTEKKINQIFTKLIDRDLASIALLRNHHLSLRTYCDEAQFYAEHRDKLNAWKADHKNKWQYLVGLPKVDFVEKINNPNLFSYSTMNQEFGLTENSFINKACFRAYINLPSTLFKMFQFCKQKHQVPNDRVRQVFLYWLTQTPHKKIKVWACMATICFVDRIFFSFNYNKSNAQVFLSKLVYVLNAVYEHYLDLWNSTRSKKAFFQHAHYSAQIHQLYDYLFHQESNLIENDFSCFNNLKDVNSKSTLKSITNKSKQWHKALILKKDAENLICFNYPPLDRNIDGYKFEVIKDSNELAIEGSDMSHCIYSYKHRIAERQYMAFKVENEDKTVRASLGITMHHELDYIQYRFNQCFGAYNAIVDEQTHIACNKLIQQLKEEQPILSKHISLDGMFYSDDFADQDFCDLPF